MATQGLVSVVWAGRVVAKVVSGSDGMKAKDVARSIVAQLRGGVPDVGFLDAIADAHGFGHQGINRIAVAKESNVPSDDRLLGIGWLVDEGEDELVDRIRRTFHMRRFNPRWDKGSADHVWIANMDTGNAYRSRSGMPLPTGCAGA
jgi:hypothetical protein